MIEYQNINRNEGGLAVRGKLNNMFSSLITGNEGVNSVWVSIQKLLTSQAAAEILTEAQYEELKEQVLKAFDHTDTTAQDLLVYINAINGGVTGFADNTEYYPDVPIEDSATFIAVDPGTYTYFLDSSGNSITITEDNQLVIFYKASGVSYWKYKTVIPHFIINEVVQSRGSSTSAVMSQNAVTSELTTLEENALIDKVGIFSGFVSSGTVVNETAIISDGEIVFHTVNKRFYYNFKSTLYTDWNVSGVPKRGIFMDSYGNVLRNKLFVWENATYIWSTTDGTLSPTSMRFLVLSEQEYENIENKDSETFYFIYEEE